MKKRYQIFVSSTYKDLIEERLIVKKAILEMKHFPAGMEEFPALDKPQMEYIKEMIDESSYYIGYSRVITNKIPMYVCLGTKVNSKIGLLTADEVSMAGASTSENKSFYLYSDKISSAYYLMTGAKYENDLYYPFLVGQDGNIITDTSGNLLRAVRPVINIIKNAKVTGDGTLQNPYQIVT